MKRSSLRSTLAQESRAYGFTIAFWGSGAILIGSLGLPTVTEAFLYGFGAVLGFGFLAIWAYSKAFGSVEEEKSEDLLVLSMVHFLAPVIPVFVTVLVTRLPENWAFFSAGAVVSIGYNLGMIVEEYLYEEAEKLEDFLLDTIS